MGLEALIIGATIAAGIGGGIALSKSGGRAEGAPSSPQPIPQAPEPAQAQAKAEENLKRRRASMTQSVYTSPLGVQGEAQVVRKTLLGQ